MKASGRKYELRSYKVSALQWLLWQGAVTTETGKDLTV